MPNVVKGLKFNPASDSQTGIMSAADQINYFSGWTYVVQKDLFARPSDKLVLSPEAFDRYLGGHRFYIGLSENSVGEYSQSASHTFTHTRVVQGFPKFVDNTSN